MGKEVKKISKKITPEKTNSTKEENKIIVEELKNTAKNVKKELSKAKDIVVKGIKNNTENIPDEMRNIKDKLSEKAVETKEKIIEEVNKNMKYKNDNISNKELNSKSFQNNNDNLNNFINLAKEKTNLFIEHLKKIDRKRIIVILIIIFSIIFIISNSFNNNTKYKYDYDYIEEIVFKYRVKINIDFEENLLFSKYDVDLSSTDNLETLKHGKDKTVELYLEEGEHILTFTNSDDSEISKQITINVTSNMEVGVKISCHYNKILVTKTYTDKDEEMISNEIKMTNDKTFYVYKNYKDVIKELEKLGFINIVENPMYDIVLGWTDEGEVDNVKINDKDDYKRGDVFKNDVKVVVSYHMNANDDPSKIKPPYSTSSASGKKYEEIVKAFKDAGFTNVSAAESANYFNKKEQTVSSITADGSSISIDKAYKQNVKIEIKYYGNPKDYDSKEEDELTLYYAKKAFEEYGKKKYPYGFKCHWILNNIASEQSKNGTSWYFKVGVTIENAYGNKYDAIAEGTVSGNDYSQKVTGFYVN